MKKVLPRSTRRPYVDDVVTTSRPTDAAKPTTPRNPGSTTTVPFSHYYDIKGNQPQEIRTVPSRHGSGPWIRGGKDSIPDHVAAHLTHRDHLEAIHEHLKYIYDRLDDLLDRVHMLELRQSRRN